MLQTLPAEQVEVSYKNIKEIRTAPRAFGLWGDAVIFLKVGGSMCVWRCGVTLVCMTLFVCWQCIVR